MIGGAVLLLVVAALAAGIVAVVRRVSPTDRATGAPEGHEVRRLFHYLLLFVLLVVSAMGVSGLLGALLTRGTTLAASDTAIARSVAFTAVGLPLLLGLAWLTRRVHAQDASERRSIPWVLYLSAASFVSLIVAVVTLHSAITGAFGLRLLDPTDIANGLVWSGVWALHWRLCRRQPDPSPLQPLQLAGSLFGLTLGLIGLATILSATLERWFGLAGGDLIVGRNEPILGGAVTLGLGGAVWARYWVFAALRSARSLLWHAYVLLVGAAGLVVALTAASLAADRVLVWLLGQPGTDDGRRYFDPMPATVAAAAAGLLALAYHQAVLRGLGHKARTEVERIRDYLLSAIGLGAVYAGATIVVVALVEAAADPSLASSGTAANTLIAALTLLGAGTPVWQLFWRRGQHAAVAGPDEVGSPTRRLYLFLLLGVTSLATVVALLAGAWVLVDRVLQGAGTAETVRSIRYPLGVLATAAAVAAYHFAVYRADRERHPTAPRRPRPFVLLLGVADAATTAAVGRRLGATACAWTRPDVPLEQWPVDDLVAAAEGCGAPETLVLADAGQLRGVPISRHPPVGAPAGTAAPTAPDLGPAPA